MQIFHTWTHLVMWIYVLFGALASADAGTSRGQWGTSRHTRGTVRENDVIKSDDRKKVLHKPSSTLIFNSKTKSTDSILNSKGVTPKMKPKQDLKLLWFLQADRNGDGFLSAREYAKTQSKGMREAAMVVDSFDQDNDRLVSKLEYLKATANAVGQYAYKNKFIEHKACSVKSVNKCAVKMIKNVLKNRGLVRCNDVTVFAECVSRHSRKCETNVRKSLQRLVQTISKTLQPKHHCGRGKWRGLERKNRTVKSSYSPTGVLVCSRHVIKSIVSSDNNCDMLKQYRTCIQSQHRSAPRPLRRALRHAARSVIKTCRRVRDNI